MNVTIILLIILVLILSMTPVSQDFAVQTMLRGSSRYALASLQDRSPMIALLHANYGAGYFWAMRDAYRSDYIEQKTGINLLDYEKKITDIQDQATKAVTKLCPQFTTNLDLSLAKIANEM